MRVTRFILQIPPNLVTKVNKSGHFCVRNVSQHDPDERQKMKKDFNAYIKIRREVAEMDLSLLILE